MSPRVSTAPQDSKHESLITQGGERCQATPHGGFQVVLGFRSPVVRSRHLRPGKSRPHAFRLPFSERRVTALFPQVTGLPPQHTRSARQVTREPVQVTGHFPQVTRHLSLETALFFGERRHLSQKSCHLPLGTRHPTQKLCHLPLVTRLSRHENTLLGLRGRKRQPLYLG